MNLVSYVAVEGLSNRLRTHFSAHAYALHNHRQLVIDWSIVQALGARYRDLFEMDGFYEMDTSLYHRTKWKMARYRTIRFNSDYSGLLRDISDLPVPQVGNTLFGEAFCPWAYDNGGSILGPYKDQVIASAKPIEVIQETINQLKAPLMGRRTLGMHIRRGDFVLSNPDQSVRVDFYECLIDKLTQSDPNLQIFLSTDDHEFVEPFVSGNVHIQKKKERTVDSVPYEVFAYDNKCNRDTVQGAHEAVADLYTLSGCDVILGTNSSSFSKMAAFIGDSPLVIAMSDKDPTETFNELSAAFLRRRPAWLREGYGRAT